MLFSHTHCDRKRKPEENTEKKPQPNKTLLKTRLCGNVLLEGTHEGVLLLLGLETSVSELGRGVDPLELDLLEGLAGSVGEERLAESHDTLLDTRARSLDHDEVILDNTVAGESSHGGL
jgi:hypothetical protein